MRHADRYGDVVHHALEVFLKQMLVTTVTATTIAQEQDCCGVGVQTLAVTVPKHPQAVAGACGGVPAEPHMYPALITGEIVATMRNDYTRGQTGEIMIKGFERLLAVDFAVAIERSQVFLLLGIDAQDGVTRFEKRLDEMRQMAELLAAMRRVTPGQHLEELAPGPTEPIENTSHDAGPGTDRAVLQAFGNLLVGQICPHHVLAPRVASGTVFDRVLDLLGQGRVFDLRLFASASGLADATSRRVIGQLLELLHTVFDGLRVASQDLRDVAGAAMPQFDRFECGQAAAVLF